jgi:outer membrane cobalamin receptor
VLVLGHAAGAAEKNRPARGQNLPVPAAAAPAPAGGAIGSLDVVTAEQIAATASTSIAAALALVPTLVVTDTGGPAGQVTVSVRGSDTRQALVLVDGHRVSAAPSVAFDLNDLAVPVERIVRIEVIPAPLSVVYGPDAVGGVVNIVTRPPGVAPGIGLSYGRGDAADQRIAGGLQYGLKALGLRVDGELSTGDGFRDNGDYDRKSITVGMAVAPAPWGLDVRWTTFDREDGMAGPAASPSPEARLKEALDGLRADVVYLAGSGWDLRAGVFTRSQSLRLTDPAPPVVDPLVASAPLDSREKYDSFGVEVRLNLDTKGGEVYTVGADWVTDKFDGASEGVHEAERWSVFAQDQWRSGTWSAVGAIRRDQHSEFGGRTYPSLSVGWGSDGWKLWAAWARNYRTPGFDELYRDRQFLKGNPDLEAETAESFDGGIEIGGAGGLLRVSAFRRSVDNLITWSDADGDFVLRAVNVAQATVSGYEAEAVYRPSASIAIPVGYQRLSSEESETHEILPGSVRSIWRAAIQGTFKSFTCSIEYAATNRFGAQPDGGFDNATVFNAALGWHDKIAGVPVQVSLRAENLQDRAYETVTGYPMRGRTWFAEVKVGL